MHDKERLEDVRWLASSLSATVAIVLMQITETTHPPAGATALLAAVNEPVYELGWYVFLIDVLRHELMIMKLRYYLPVILLSSTLILAVALLINNIQRRYPVFWFKPIIEPPAPVEPALGGPEADEDENNNNGSSMSNVSSGPEGAGASMRTASVHSISPARSETQEKAGEPEKKPPQGQDVILNTDPSNMV